ncbi:hypothetical protein ES708_09883 [subsurface metagenome]
MDSKDYSWKWVTAEELLSHGACELCYVKVNPVDSTCNVTIYDGENALGRIIAVIDSEFVTNCELLPKEPIYCRRGLFIGLMTGCAGMLVQWRELGHKEGG